MQQKEIGLLLNTFAKLNVKLDINPATVRLSEENIEVL